MTTPDGKPASMNRRSFLLQASGMPLQLIGVSRLLARPTLVGLVAGSSGIVACGENKISGPTEKYNDGEANTQGNLKNKNAETYDSDTYQGQEGNPLESDHSLTNNEDQNNTGASDSSGEFKDNSSPKIVSKVQGARPNGGFFSRGAPQITKAQIESGVAIEATCEGTNHKLVITPEHLAQLAEGKTVRITSETKTHFGNPTVHNHTITYSPV